MERQWWVEMCSYVWRRAINANEISHEFMQDNEKRNDDLFVDEMGAKSPSPLPGCFGRLW